MGDKAAGMTPLPDLQYRYQHTFITIEEPNETTTRRSKSLPPNWTATALAEMETTEAQVKESEMAEYVTGLARNAAHFFGQRSNMQQDAEVHTLTKADADATSERDASGSDRSSHSTELASRGSLGHPNVCRRPCVYFKSGSCEHGSACGFCHMDHTLPLPKLDKKQRELMKSFSKTEVLSIMLHYLRLVAVKQGFALQATEILRLVEHEVLAEGSDPKAALANIPEKMFSRLHKMLGRMHFAGIVGLASKEQVGAQLKQDLADGLERLRANAPAEP